MKFIIFFTIYFLNIAFLGGLYEESIFYGNTALDIMKGTLGVFTIFILFLIFELKAELNKYKIILFFNITFSIIILIYINEIGLNHLFNIEINSLKAGLLFMILLSIMQIIKIYHGIKYLMQKNKKH
ncbi:MAG: hypothetical protein N4A38_00510 [Candidatus Gracilibacteria bacterium]|nr:hypothetical protein [Candidatus Gracilibacteria bacterium]